MVFCLAIGDLPLNATWAANAITVAGSAAGTAGFTGSGLWNPAGITISTDDILYVADTDNSQVVVVNLTSLAVISTGSNGFFGNNQFTQPQDVWITQTFLYVIGSFTNGIQKMLKNGTNPSTITGTGSFDSGNYMFIDRYGSIYVSDSVGCQVIRFSPNSSDFLTIAGNGTAGNQSNQLNNPLGIYVDDNLTLYIADAGNYRIQMWKYAASFGLTVAGNETYGSSLVQLSPSAIVVDKNGYMYIVDSDNNQVVRWAPNATSGVCIVACTGAFFGSGANELSSPVSLAFDSSGSLYVSDQSNNRVQKFQILTNGSNYFTV